MTRTEKLVTLALVVAALDVGMRIGAQQATRPTAAMPVEFATSAMAQTPVVGVSLQPRYVITANQTGNVIYVWEDQGKGYQAKIFTAGR